MLPHPVDWAADTITEPARGELIKKGSNENWWKWEREELFSDNATC